MKYLFTVWIIALVADFALADENEIIIKSSASVYSADVTLGDIAEGLSTKLSGLSLGTAPARGKTVAWSASEVSAKLRSYQEALRNFHFKIPKRVKITKVDAQISDATIKNKIVRMLKALLPSSDWEVKLISLQKIQWPELSSSARVSVVPLNIRPKGAAQFEIVVEDQGKTLQHLWVNGEVEYFARVPVVQKIIYPRQKITPELIGWEKRNVTYLADNPASELDLTSSVSKQQLTPGIIISKSYLERELAVKFGEEVEVFTNSDLISVTARAVAQQNAYVGDQVKLRTAGNKYITGTVQGRKQVQVSF